VHLNHPLHFLRIVDDIQCAEVTGFLGHQQQTITKPNHVAMLLSG
jgi:hypothetical protein